MHKDTQQYSTIHFTDILCSLHGAIFHLISKGFWVYHDWNIGYKSWQLQNHPHWPQLSVCKFVSCNVKHTNQDRITYTTDITSNLAIFIGCLKTQIILNTSYVTPEFPPVRNSGCYKLCSDKQHSLPMKACNNLNSIVYRKILTINSLVVY